MKREQQLEEIFLKFENDEIDYKDFTKRINELKITKEEFCDLITDDVAEKIEDPDDINCIGSFLGTIRMEIEKKIGRYWTDYTFLPSENGGVFIEQKVIESHDLNLGILTNFLNITVVAEINMDFRPNCYTYVALYILQNNKEKKNR